MTQVSSSLTPVNKLTRIVVALIVLIIIETGVFVGLFVKMNQRVDGVAKIAQAAADVEDVSAKVDTLSSDVDDLSSKVDDIESRISDLESRVNP
jgi:outer membrane murein-binding lipoprotein Lpp